MEITINDVKMSLPDGSTLSDALSAKDIRPQGIATALNGIVIGAADRAETPLNDGDRIVIIKAFYGG